jgi:hypothetical protein
VKRWQGAVLGLAGLVLGALGMRLVAPMVASDDHPPAKAEAADAGPGLHVEDKVQQQAGLRIAPLAARRVSAGQDGFARGLDPAPLGTIASEIAAATAAHDASSRELARLTALVAADAGASRRDLDTARAQEGQDRARLTLACQRPGLEIGPALGKLGCGAVARLAAGANGGRLALLRIDFADGAVPAGSSVTIDLGKTEATVRVLGPAVAGDTQLQSAGVLALLEGPDAALAGVGRVLSAHRASGAARDGMIVPRSAIVRADGTLQVWRATGPENFERVPIGGAIPVADGWFVAAGGALKPGDKLVVAGAGTLLGLERSPAGGGGGGD